MITKVTQNNIDELSKLNLFETPLTVDDMVGIFNNQIVALIKL